MSLQQPQIAVIGAAVCDEATSKLAEAVGQKIAQRHGILICGGLGGVMEAAARGAKESGGITLGILPGSDPQEANPYIALKVVTNLGHARNVLIAHSADALIAVAGGYGTLSEIAIALKIGKPVVALNSWQPTSRVTVANTPEDAVNKAFAAIDSFSSTAT